jgi:hypothetical protein
MNRPLRLFLILLFLIVATAALLAINLDYLAEYAISENGSTMTKAAVSVDTVKIASAKGKGTIGTLVVGNPPGFKTPHAFKAGTIEVDFDLASLTSDAVVIRVITISGPDVIYEHGETMTNFDAIQNNIAAQLATMRRNSNTGGIKLIVEELSIYNATAWASAPFMGGKTISIPLQDITLRNIGKDRGGVTQEELGVIVTGALKARLASAANIDKLAKATGTPFNQ